MRAAREFVDGRLLKNIKFEPIIMIIRELNL